MPSSPPSLAVGELLYADRCAACHGLQGMGDGEMVEQLEFPPAALADPQVAAASSPQAWYQTVTNGNLERLMPPFPSLSDQQRWDVVAFALSLSLSDEQLQTGETLFVERCGQCHSPPDFGSDYYWSTSRDSISAVIENGRGSEMPGFADQFDAEQLRSVAGYVQSLAWSAARASEPAAEQPAASFTSLTGKVTNGTRGGSVPTDLQVSVHGFDGEQQVLDETVAVDAQGEFVLDQVEAVAGRLFFATVEYQQVQYRSELAHAPTDGSQLELPLTIYETSSDPSPLQVERLHLLIEFPEEQLMRVLQLWVVGNQSDRVVTPALRVPLPDSATNLGFEEGAIGDRYQSTDSGFIDMEPVPPGSAIDQLVFGFDLPLEGAMDYRQPLEHPVQAVTVLVPEDGPRLTGLVDEGVRDLGGFRMRSYAASGLQAGDSLDFGVAGSGGLPAHTGSLAAGALALVIAVLVVMRSWTGRQAAIERAHTASPAGYDAQQPPAPAAHVAQRPPADEPGPPGLQSLLRDIARLDADHQAGKLATEQWEQQRAELKRRALERMRDSDE